MNRNEDEQLDYSVVDKEHPDHEESVVSDAEDPYCNSAPDEHKGTRWFDVRNATLAQSVDLSRGRHIQTEPRAWDKKASDIPLCNPLRAIAKMLDDTPISSII
jgi:hypothetical protein